MSDLCRRLFLMFLILHLVIISHGAVHAAVIHVKSSGNDINSGATWDMAKKTVTAAINIAAAGDEIWVAAGTYQENIHNKVVNINGVNTAVDIALYGGFAGTETARDQRNWKNNQTILDGSSSGVVVSITNGASLATRIDGFRITNGTGGVSIFGSAATIVNNTIRGNNGTGVLCSDYKIIGVIPPNVVFAVITDNIIVDNSSGSGAGIAITGSNTIAQSNLPPSQPTISRNTIARNTAGDDGGGIGCWGHTAPLISNNFILANTAASLEDSFTGGGGCIYATSNDMSGAPVEYAISAPVIINNVIAANGGGLGGGISTIDTDIGVPVITNNTIVGNNGSGIWWSTSYGNYAPKLQNNLVAFNTWGIEQAGSTYPPTIKNNCVYGNSLQGNGTDYKGIADQTGTNGNISVNPNLANYRIGDFHLQPGSPCINAGTLDAVSNGWTDIDGQNRVIGNSVDIGADESDGTLWNVPTPIIHVRTGGNDTQNGLTWATAKKTITGGIAAVASTGGEVWVAAGTYSEHMTIPAFVYLYGGFAGTETTRDERNISANVTIIDGGGIHGVVAVRNAGYLLSALDGFTVQNGGSYTYGDWTKQNGIGGLGGGVYISAAGPYISNNTIRLNSLANDTTRFPNPPSHGGGIYCYLNHGEISGNTITDNEILNANAFDGSGGGIYCIHSMPVIDHNTITKNHARSGSAIYATDCAAKIFGNVIQNNTMYNTYPLPVYLGSVTGAIDVNLSRNFLIEGNLITGNSGASGGGINASTNLAGSIQNNLLIGNAATDPTAGNGGMGGGIYALAPTNANDALYIVNNTIVGNTATAYGSLEQGGGIAVSIPPPIVTPPVPPAVRISIANNIIAFNSSGIFETLTSPVVPPTLLNNDIYGTNSNLYYMNFPAGPTDIHADPALINRTAGDFHLGPVSSCIDSGSNSAVPAWLTNDYEGNARIIDGNSDGNAVVDIGAYEYVGLSKPDLIVQNIVTVPATPLPNQAVGVTVTVKNQGAANAGPFRVDFYKDLTSAPVTQQTGDFLCSMSQLAASSSDTCVGTVSYSLSGSYSMWAQADTAQQVTESNESNNVFGPQIINVLSNSQFTISTSVISGNGSVICIPTAVNYGGSSVCSITPLTGNYVSDVFIDGVSQNSCMTAYTFSNVTSNRTIAAVFAQMLSVRIERTCPVYYSSLQTAYDATLDSDIIDALAADFNEDVSFSRAVAVTFSGGYDTAYSGNTGMTGIRGVLRISGSGSVTIGRLVIK